ncbi:MAG: sensor histidine kinase [Chloroflexi bacterium]|nr:sensor histidine kinase [Chloroflexota bacterium]
MAATHRSNPILYAAAYLTTGVVFGISLLFALDNDNPGQIAALGVVFGLFTLVLTLLMAVTMPVWLVRSLFVVECILVAMLFFAAPESSGFAPILLVMLAALAFFSFGSREQIVWGVIFLVEIFGLLALVIPLDEALLNGALYVGIIAFVWAVARSLQSEQQARAESQRLAAELERANAQLRESAWRTQELAVAQERTRLAREIHDSLGHHLTVLSVQLQAASRLFERDPARAAREIENARSIVAQALQDVRHSVSALREVTPPDLRDPDALARLVRDFGDATGIVTEFRADNFDAAGLSPAQAHTLYRVVQEGLTNAQKHAHASRIDVSVIQADGKLCARVVDNGCDALHRRNLGAATAAGFGLMGLRERVELLGGTLSAAPRAEGGFELRAEIPVEQRRD